jgi:hypothetical protein
LLADVIDIITATTKKKIIDTVRLLLKCNDINNIEHQDNDGRAELFWGG